LDVYWNRLRTNRRPAGLFCGLMARLFGKFCDSNHLCCVARALREASLAIPYLCWRISFGRLSCLFVHKVRLDGGKRHVIGPKSDKREMRAVRSHRARRPRRREHRPAFIQIKIRLTFKCLLNLAYFTQRFNLRLEMHNFENASGAHRQESFQKRLGWLCG